MMRAALQIAIVIVVGVSMWRVFVKAGVPGWHAIVPVYNVFAMFRIAGLPVWQPATLVVLWLAEIVVDRWFGPSAGGFVFALAIPVAGAGLWVMACMGVAAKFDKGTGFALGMALAPFVFYPILAFGPASYGVPQQRQTLGLSGA